MARESDVSELEASIQELSTRRYISELEIDLENCLRRSFFSNTKKATEDVIYKLINTNIDLNTKLTC
jgi:hypothetical protein